MKGTRPLTNEEIRQVAAQFSGAFAVRNRCLFILGVSVGGRISEMLALRVGDVWQNGQPVTEGQVKGRENARMVPVNSDGRGAIADLIAWHQDKYGMLDRDRPLFPSRKKGGRLGREQAHRILAEAFVNAGLNGKLATHSLRKSFAQRIYETTGDIYLVKELLGHREVETTRE